MPFPDGIQLSAVVLQQCSGVMNCTDNGSDLVWGSFEEVVLRSAFEISSDFRRALSSLSVYQAWNLFPFPVAICHSFLCF